MTKKNMRKGLVKERYIWFLIGIAGALLFLASGYYIAGAFSSIANEAGLESSFWERLVEVLSHPFSNYYNIYTPVTMVLAFVIYELLFFLLIVFCNWKRARILPEIMRSGSEKEKNAFLVEEPKVDIPVMELPVDRNKDIGLDADRETEIAISEGIFLDLSGSYSLEQITEMIRLSQYIDVNAPMLARMFDPNMTAGEIRSYIDMFYG